MNSFKNKFLTEFFKHFLWQRDNERNYIFVCLWHIIWLVICVLLFGILWPIDGSIQLCVTLIYMCLLPSVAYTQLSVHWLTISSMKSTEIPITIFVHACANKLTGVSFTTANLNMSSYFAFFTQIPKHSKCKSLEMCWQFQFQGRDLLFALYNNNRE